MKMKLALYRDQQAGVAVRQNRKHKWKLQGISAIAKVHTVHSTLYNQLIKIEQFMSAISQIKQTENSPVSVVPFIWPSWRLLP